jgi:hypothetical protein
MEWGNKPAQAVTNAKAGAAAGAGFEDMEEDIPFVSSSMQYDMESSNSRRMRRYDY